MIYMLIPYVSGLITYLDTESVRIELLIAVNELQEVAHRREHALSDVISTVKVSDRCENRETRQLKAVKHKKTNRGKLSASSKTTLMPSRARAEEA
jgi:hypothetical protein